MRKKSRYIKNGALGGAFAFVLLDGISQYVKLKEEGKPFWDNLDIQQSILAGSKGLIMGGISGYLLYQLLQWEEKDLPFSPDSHLYKVLNAYSARQNPQFVEKAKKIIYELKENIVFEFSDLLVGKPIDFGSEKTRTAISQISDFDILVPFKKGSGSIQYLYDEVYHFLEENYDHENFEIRKQRHSIGLSFENGELFIHIDLVPAKERNNYHKTGDITIIKRGKYIWEASKTIKSNIWVKRRIVVNQPEVRRIIKLIKVYRGESSIHLKSPVIVALAKEAFQKNKGYINTSIYNNWLLTMSYIVDQLQMRNTIIDPANSNNNLLDKMSSAQKDEVIDLIISDLQKLEQSPRYLKEIFEIE